MATEESMHKLYGAQGAGSAAVEMALHHAGLQFEVVRAATWEPDSALDELGRVNPLRQVPTLVLPSGAVMTESAAILLHLGLVAPPGRLLPIEPGARAQSIRGLVFIAANCYSAIGICDHPERWTTATDELALEALRQGARAQLHRHWEIFADLFPAAPYLGGSEIGALDMLAVVVSHWSGARAHLAAHRPAFAAVLERIEAHPAVAPVVAAHWPP